ncbi:asparagine synthase (glutamine-hydrolyzing) [Segetibacter sp. 3557_3]|uniref:asparagine synthase (glutamine-hydrolyzing) n=1 Tax=Segetibacter sp. 3557_3 TaxID=2547429 RepID=UPI0010588ED1|nr:asparagine synthase (glutamine-hydrolyzing) [Segetibacter sp. 3557_3]TDH23286.1 asparagine synthase (glutamine-hydrolyzing) [Segetibacter sp. 3557_3]
MCRIAGIFKLGSSTLHEDVLRLRDSMHRGGPDDEGIYVDDSLPLALGHRRLSLIDLSPAGHQPMSDRNGDLQLIFNGEIYNFLELKATLSGFGHVFTTKSDTEVILKAYSQWGISCFTRFNGMFAIALWDKSKQELILARDHAGIKPLYYSLTKDTLVFASEIRAFKAYRPDWPESEEWKIPFLTFGHIPEPFTTLKNVQPLAKGTCAVIKLPSLSITHHVSEIFQFSSLIKTLPEAVAQVKDKLDKAVERHLISDAPIGLFLSGGVDSSLLTLIAQKYTGKNLNTLSIVFEDATLSEEPYQKIIIDKSKAHHQSFLVSSHDFENELPDILEAMDQPSIDGINSYFICKYARQYGLTAVLSGLGADELFGGYNSFRYAPTAALIRKFPSFLPGMANVFPKDKIKKLAALQRKDAVGEYLFNRGLYTTAQTAALLSISVDEVNASLDKVAIAPLPANTDSRNRASHIETNLYMQNQLLKDCDYMSMWHSLEVRVPFLDKELMKTAYSIDPDIKYDKQIGKHLLIKAFDDLLPKEIWQRKKQGFTFPFYKWMRNVQSTQRDDNYRGIRHKFTTGSLHWSKYWLYLLNNKNAIKCFAPQAPSVLFLTLCTFSATGGIEKFNRSFLKALHDLEAEGKLTADAASMYDSSTANNYFEPKNMFAFAGNRVRFIREVVNLSKYYDKIVVGHINLALAAYLIKLKHKAKKILVVAHGIEVWNSGNDAIKLSAIKKAVINSADKILAVSNFTKQRMVQNLGLKEDKISIFPNTIDPYFNYPDNLAKPAYLKERYQLNGQKIIYTLTRLSSSEQYKGYDRVLEALPEIKKRVPGIKYIIAGKADDAEKARIEAMIKKLDLQDTVMLVGFLKNEELTDHYLLADVFILPSTMEGFGIVYIEAMACGLPVVAGNVDGSVDALKNGELGRLIDPVSIPDIVESLSVPQHAGTMPSGKKLQSMVHENFGFESYRERLRKALTE